MFQYKNFGISTNPIAKMDPCVVTPTKEKEEPKDLVAPGAPPRLSKFATRCNAGVKRGRNFEEEFNSVSKEAKL